MYETLYQRFGKDHKNISICRVLILHTRLEFGEDVEFLVIYYARGDGDEQRLREIFAEAFRQAHPEWKIKQVIVDTKHSKHSSESGFLDVGVMFPEDLPDQVT